MRDIAAGHYQNVRPKTWFDPDRKRSDDSAVTDAEDTNAVGVDLGPILQPKISALEVEDGLNTAAPYKVGADAVGGNFLESFFRPFSKIGQMDNHRGYVLFNQQARNHTGHDKAATEVPDDDGATYQGGPPPGVRRAALARA